MPPNNCAVTATVTSYSEPTLSFPFSRKLPLNSFVTPTYSFYFVNH